MDILGLRRANCKSCHKCIRVCPVKSIEFSGQQAKIIGSECILCGQCVVTCPQNAKVVRSDLPRVKQAMAEGRRVVASLAPSFIVDFPVDGVEEMAGMLEKLGFAATAETAHGAFLVKSEYERMVGEKRQDIIISTCCPSAVRLVQKYFPDLVDCLAPVVSPMEAHARYLKEQDPDAYVVFIGPCISKKAEAEDYPDSAVDCVLTFEELRGWAEEAGVEPESIPCDRKGRRSRFFPKTGGIIQSMDRENTGYRYYAVDGPDRCVAALRDIRGGRLHNVFLEISICEGSCVSGPMIRASQGGMLECQDRVTDYAAPGFPDRRPVRDFDTADVPLEHHTAPQPVREKVPTDEELTAILEKMGKTSSADELNCGSCGYPTCREKAKAVFNGKAEITMCLPYMRERAESLSDKILGSTPNAILVVGEDLTVQQINGAGCRLLELPRPEAAVHKPVEEFLDPVDFIFVMEDGRPIKDRKVWLEGCKKFVEETIVYDIENKLLLAIMKDITAQEEENRRTQELRQQTLDVTDRIIQKQMRTVQEIASLLGETTAETKVALTKLRGAVAEGEKRE